ncbi:nuclear transport factor 2 family protein [Cellulomonas soli]|uniref:nuclear transport factor 2 family protein n=1 Tax=Cellulomonas soli TaxID=931535 RepID=UPI003F850DF5
MTTSSPDRGHVTDAVRAAWVEQREAMVAADTGALDALLGEEFTLTHLTGYVQPKHEWLEAIDSGEMRYHGIEDVETAVEGDADAPVLTVRTRTLATIGGSRGNWRLQLRVEYAPDGPEWVAVRSVASVW